MRSVWHGLVICLFGLGTHGLGPLTRTVCLFEGSQCGWTDDTEGLNWDYERASASGGLSRDHTLGTNAGSYQRIDPETTRKSRGATNPIMTAKFTSPTFPADDRYCIQFWYKLYGGDTIPIKVYVQIYGGVGYPVRIINSGNGRQWTLAEIDIDSEYTSAPFNFVIESGTVAYRYYIATTARYSYHNKGMMTVFDDIYIVNRGCRAIPNCPEGFEVLESESSNTLTCVLFNTTATTWATAVKHCRSISPYGHLVSVDEVDKERQLIRYINANNEYRAAAASGVWTSGSDKGSEGIWYWTDKGDPERLNYRNWRLGQPNNVGSRQHCLSMNYPQLGYQWGDEFCDLTKPFICQIHLNTTHLSSGGNIG